MSQLLTMSVVIAVDSVQTAESLIPWAVLNLDSGRNFVIVKARLLCPTCEDRCACAAPVHGNEMLSGLRRTLDNPR